MSNSKSSEKSAGVSSDPTFYTAYKRLNDRQQEAVDTIEGPVMVIAGPGTGKTQILTLRIANILAQTDTKPDQILALTFTDSGAKAMRQRLFEYIGSASYKVAIFTFHSFAQRLIADYPDAYPKIVGGRPARDIEKISMIRNILDQGEVENLRPAGNPQYYIKSIQGMISDLKREYVTPDKLAKIINVEEKELENTEKIHQKGAHKGKVKKAYSDKEKSIAKNKSLLHVYRQYESYLKAENLFDFDDMILETVRALEGDESMLLDLQEQYQYILADEHQDVNGSQNRILELLASYHDSPNIFVVGDEKQAIFRFQGASLENFLYFGELFKDTKTIALSENYRSGQEILDVAHDLIQVEEGPLKDLRVPLQAFTKQPAEVSRRDFSHEAIEDDWVVKRVLESIEEGVPKHEIAVIVRSNKEVEHFSNLIRRSLVPVQASADSDILDHPITHTIEQLMQAVISNDNLALFTVLHGAYWGITRSDLVRITSAQSYDRNLLQILEDDDFLRILKLDNLAAVNNVLSVLKEARKRSVTEVPYNVLAYLVEASGLKDFIMTTDPLETSRVVRRLYDEVKELVEKDNSISLSDVAGILNQRRQFNLPLEAPYITVGNEAVQVMTAHKSKGLEFSVVIAPHLNDGSWGGKVNRKNFDIVLPTHLKEPQADKMDDEKRLLYVVMTRAKTKLYLSLSQTNSEGKIMSPTRLFDDINPDLVTVVDISLYEAEFQPLDNINKEKSAISVDEKLLKAIISEKGFSATSFNNYLSSPWTYYYRNLLRIPEVQSLVLQFGTAVHNVLQKVTVDYSVNKKLPSDSIIEGYLEKELSRLPIGAEDFTRLHKKGFEALLTYLPKVVSGWYENIKVEMPIRVMLETGLLSVPMVPLTGKLDRLDMDEAGRVVRVVDYKTGKPKTRNVIEGKTKSSDGNYKRQLVFYALLLDLYDDDRYKCREGVLSFVEADSKGEIHEEPFTITDEEIEELKQQIIRAVEDIASGEFLKSDCDPKVCDYCHLVALLTDSKID
ncbi:ATP-dependent helicase [Candidatus Kaiserbacteria bacterium]|nr:ATP-dependent helicase [Candidatus Kaiserbacteria bacterium]